MTGFTDIELKFTNDASLRVDGRACTKCSSLELLQKIGTPPHRPHAKIYIDFSEKIRKVEVAGKWVDI